MEASRASRNDKSKHKFSTYCVPSFVLRALHILTYFFFFFYQYQISSMISVFSDEEMEA